MALIEDSQLTALAEDIVPALPAEHSDAQTEARAVAVASTKDLATKLMQYIVDQIEIGHAGKKITVDTGTLLIPPAAVAPMDGGLLLYSGQLVTDLNAKTLSQDNDGKGLVL